MVSPSNTFTESELKHFEHCLALAKEALEAGDDPFGSILVNNNNEVMAEARNRVNERNVLAHPEIELADWAIQNLTAEERKSATMYTSGEHCPMCAGAHGWAGIGRLCYLSSGKQLRQWLAEMDATAAPVNFIPAENIIRNCTITGPASGPLLEKIKALHQKNHQAKTV